MTSKLLVSGRRHGAPRPPPGASGMGGGRACLLPMGNTKLNALGLSNGIQTPCQWLTPSFQAISDLNRQMSHVFGHVHYQPGVSCSDGPLENTCWTKVNPFSLLDDLQTPGQWLSVEILTTSDEILTVSDINRTCLAVYTINQGVWRSSKKPKGFTLSQQVFSKDPSEQDTPG